MTLNTINESPNHKRASLLKRGTTVRRTLRNISKMVIENPFSAKNQIITDGFGIPIKFDNI